MSASFITPDYLGYRETSLNSALIVCSTLFWGLRMYVRLFMTKSPGFDDLLATIAWMMVIVQSALDVHAVSLGSGAHIGLIPENLLMQFFKSLIIQTLLYFWGVALVRLSVLAFLPRLISDKKINYILYGLAFIILAQTIVAFVYRLTECMPVSDNFLPPILPGLNCKGLESDQKMMVGHGSVGLIVDISLLILPVYIIYTKMMWGRKTIQVLLVLSVGVFVIVTGIVRLILILTLNFTEDPTYKMATIGIWTNLEGHVGLWCVCFPAMQPILRLVSYKLGLRSALSSNPTDGRSGGKVGAKYYAKGSQSGGSVAGAGGKMNSTTSNAWSRSKNGYVKNGSGVDEDTGADSDSQKAIVFADGRGMEMHDLESGRIRKMTEVKIKSEPKDAKSWADV